jgi:hypothetical protein
VDPSSFYLYGCLLQPDPSSRPHPFRRLLGCTGELCVRFPACFGVVGVGVVGLSACCVVAGFWVAAEGENEGVNRGAVGGTIGLMIVALAAWCSCRPPASQLRVLNPVFGERTPGYHSFPSELRRNSSTLRCPCAETDLMGVCIIAPEAFSISSNRSAIAVGVDCVRNAVSHGADHLCRLAGLVQNLRAYAAGNYQPPCRIPLSRRWLLCHLPFATFVALLREIPQTIWALDRLKKRSERVA